MSDTDKETDKVNTDLIPQRSSGTSCCIRSLQHQEPLQEITRNIKILSKYILTFQINFIGSIYVAILFNISGLTGLTDMSYIGREEISKVTTNYRLHRKISPSSLMKNETIFKRTVWRHSAKEF